MNKKFLPLLLAALFFLGFYSCKKVDENNKYPDEYSRGYYPLQFGRYVVYNVDSTIWDDFLCVKTVHKYQMRYTIADTFRDNENRLSYRMDVHIRNNDSSVFVIHRVIYLTRTPTRLEYVEANVRFIKLIFPVSTDARWLGNALIPEADEDYKYFQGWNYQYGSVGADYSNGLVDFKNTVTVNEIDEQINNPELQPGAYSEKTFSKEVYGYDIGMIYRETTRWIYDPGVASCRRGYSVVMRAVDHN